LANHRGWWKRRHHHSTPATRQLSHPTAWGVSDGCQFLRSNT
jgi:hypothetical protein